MKKNKSPNYLRCSIKYNVLSNLVLGVLVLSVGALCLSPITEVISTEGDEVHVYRRAENGNGVSLMFNVYQHTEEVYKILDILDKHEAKATFFIGGCWADDNVECLKAIDNAGHEIGNHGYFHKEHQRLDLVQNKKEIDDCNQFISLAIGKKPVLFAPPSGAYNEYTLSAVTALNMKTVLWSRDTIDWRDKNSSLIYTRATKNIQCGEFVLMHPERATVDALNDIINYYKSCSLPLVTVSENLKGQK